MGDNAIEPDAREAQCRFAARNASSGPRELAERYPLDPDAPYGSPKVIRTGEAELIADVTDELLRSTALDAAQAALPLPDREPAQHAGDSARGVARPSYAGGAGRVSATVKLSPPRRTMR
jgi:hypothetical protein